MPRYPRAFLVGYPHHIVQRGHNRKPVFTCDADFEVYRSNLSEQLDARVIDLYAYCLMTNHVHLLVAPRRDGHELSDMMRVLAARQTRYVNRLEGTTGTLWDGRFKCSIVEAERYLLACCRYIERNPVRAGIVRVAEDYPWSSCRQRSALAAPVLALASLPVAAGSALSGSAYREFVAGSETLQDAQTIRVAINRNQLTGGHRFRTAIEEKLGRTISDKGQGRPARPCGK